MNWKTCFTSLAEEWCKEESYRSPLEALRHATPVTRHGTKGVVVFPDADSEYEAIDIFQTANELGALIPTLCLVCDDNLLAHSRISGNRILFVPDYPEVALTALRSASWVISFDPYVSDLCHDLGVTCFDVSGKAGHAVTLPWGSNQPKQIALTWHAAVKEVSSADRVAVMKKGEAEFGICAVADSRFIGFFFGLVENLLRVSKDTSWRIFLLALDEKAKELALAQYPNLPMTVYLASEVWPEADWKAYRHKPIAERAYASKPRAVLEATKTMGGAPLYFSDVDIHFFESPHLLKKDFGSHQLLFMPQWSDVFAWARFHGMFNSGLVGVLPGGEPFLKWWADMCVPFCRVEMEKGYFTDQVFLDMGLWHFPQIGVYREMDHNVAPWNRKTLGISRAGSATGRLLLKDGRPVKSFHAAGPDSDGYFQLKFAWDQMVSFFSVLPDPDALPPLYRNTLDQQLVYWPALRTALDVRDQWRRRFRMKPVSPSAAYVGTLLRPGPKQVTWLLKIANDLVRGLRSLFRSAPPVDNVSIEEQQMLIDIQQRVAFSPPELKPAFNLSRKSPA